VNQPSANTQGPTGLELPPKLAAAIACNLELLWQMLAVDAGCSVSVIDRDGRLCWANERTLIDYEWHLSIRNPDAAGEELDPIGKPLGEILRPEFVEERIAYIREAIDSGRTVVYESVLRGVRQRVAIRPLGGTGTDLAAMIARRLRGTERIRDLVPPGAILRVPRVQDPGLLGVLSDRELDVLKLVGDGLSSGEIARRLHRSVRTIEGHRKTIGEKLGFSRATDLVRVAIRAGLCELPDAPDNPAQE
jgi:DNA-binding CsgD family transcriptional regulator